MKAITFWNMATDSRLPPCLVAPKSSKKKMHTFYRSPLQIYFNIFLFNNTLYLKKEKKSNFLTTILNSRNIKEPLIRYTSVHGD